MGPISNIFFKDVGDFQHPISGGNEEASIHMIVDDADVGTKILVLQFEVCVCIAIRLNSRAFLSTVANLFILYNIVHMMMLGCGSNF